MRLQPLYGLRRKVADFLTIVSLRFSKLWAVTDRYTEYGAGLVCRVRIALANPRSVGCARPRLRSPQPIGLVRALQSRVVLGNQCTSVACLCYLQVSVPVPKQTSLVDEAVASR